MDSEQLKADMEARIIFRGRWFEEEYQPDLHGNPYAIIAKDMLEVAAEYIVKKFIADFLKPKKRTFEGGGILDRRKQENFPEKIPRSLTSISRFM